MDSKQESLKGSLDLTGKIKMGQSRDPTMFAVSAVAENAEARLC